MPVNAVPRNGLPLTYRGVRSLPRIHVGTKKNVPKPRPVREKSRNTLNLSQSTRGGKSGERHDGEEPIQRPVWKITPRENEGKMSAAGIASLDWRIRETRRVGALACSRVPRACAHIAKGLNGLLIDLSLSLSLSLSLGCEEATTVTLPTLNLSRHLSAQRPTESYSPGMKIDRRFEQKRTIIRDQSPFPVLFFSFLFPLLPFSTTTARGETFNSRSPRSSRNTLHSLYASCNSTKTCRRFFDFRRQGRRVPAWKWLCSCLFAFVVRVDPLTRRMVCADGTDTGCKTAV